MANKKNYALIYLKEKPIKKYFDTVTNAKYNYPDAFKIELYNFRGIKIASIK